MGSSEESAGSGSARELTGKQRRFLRSLANQLKPIVYVGREGITAGLLRSVEEAYSNHELVKIRIERGCPLNRKEAGQQLAARTGSHLVQILGQTVLLYRPDPEEPEIQLPD